MPGCSAGLLIYRLRESGPEVFLVHPGGPFWAHRDEHAWSLPKGEYTAEEEPLDAACREFREETGFDVPAGIPVELKPLRQPRGKVISAWALEGDVDATALCSNLFSMEWPPKSGRQAQFPEVDRGEWFGLVQARIKITPGQAGFLQQLEALLNAGRSGRNHAGQQD
jgi:predicted NUDIX family NTP pyrophosphohydrolase